MTTIVEELRDPMPRKRKDQHPPPPGAQRFIFWFSQSAREIRETAGVNVQTVAGHLNVDQRTITRFEKAENWPDDPDRLVAAYAAACGLQDPRRIYELALERWHEYGAMPQLPGQVDGETTVAQQYEREMTGRRARRRAPAEPGETTTGTPRRTADG